MMSSTRTKAGEDPNQILGGGMVWYYAGVVFLVLLSLLRVSKTPEAVWTVDFGTSTATPILVAFVILPFVLKFLVSHTKSGKLEVAGLFGVSWAAKEAIDRRIAETQTRQRRVAEVAKDSTKSDSDVKEMRGDAEVQVEDMVRLQDLPVVHSVYFGELMELVKAFNRNRHLRQAGRGTVAEADAIAFRMRSMAPLVLGQFDVASWLNTPNLGKQIAAIKHLDWVQDIDFALDLTIRLKNAEEGEDTFQAFHILLALLSMADQLAYDYKDRIKESLSNYVARGSDSSAREQIKKRVLDILQ